MAAPVTVSSLWATDADLQAQVDEQHHKRSRASGWRFAVLAFSTLGIVYGDIGTSPLYVYASIFPDGAPDDEKITLGAAASIVWSITAMVLVKYVVFTLAADDNGEGGVFALYALICRAAGIRSGSLVHEADLSLSQYRRVASEASPEPNSPAGAARQGGGPGSPKWAGKGGLHASWNRWRLDFAARSRAALGRSAVSQTVLLTVVLLAANMIISDGVLTPAISVVSAIEGIEFQTGISRGAIVGISIGILVVLFSVQPFGTQKVAFMFSPAVLVWFLANAIIGFYNLSHYGWGAMRAFSPHYIYYFWSGRASQAWKSLGAILLCFTGAEALYADISHFSANAVRASFLTCVYPSLLITYLGQTAMIIARPETSAAAYWESIPSPVLWPMVVVATCAAIIASQALISGCFTIVQQAMAMNAFPRMTVRHTSAKIMGQVVVKEVNWLLMLACVAVVAGFQTSAKIGNAYGLTVISVMLFDTALLAMVMVLSWEWSPLAAAAYWVPFTFLCAAFFSSTLEKVPSGAWFSLMVATVLACVTYLWHWGQNLKTQYVRKNRTLLRDLFDTDGAPLLPASPAGGAGAPNVARTSAVSAVTSVTSSDKTAVSAKSQGSLRLAGTGTPVSRVPGLGIFYSELLIGVPPVLEKSISLLPAIYSVNVLLTVRVVPVPRVMPTERLLIRRLRVPGFYHVVARYGYLERVEHGAPFVQEMVQEIFEYLHPMDVPSPASAGGAHVTVIASALPDAPEPPPSAGAAASASPADTDVELGLLRRRGAGTGRFSVAAGTVNVDPEESLGATNRRTLARELPLQLLQLQSSNPTSPGDTIMSGRGAFMRHPSLTVAVAMGEEEGKEGSESSSAAPWVQMPSVVRRVRAQMLGQPAPPPASLEIERWRRQHSGTTDDATLSLPLPDRGSRPRLRLEATAAATHGSSVASLPLPPAPPRPALPGTPRGGRSRRTTSGREPGATGTLRSGDASELGAALWDHLHSQRYVGQVPGEGSAAIRAAPAPRASEGPTPDAGEGTAAQDGGTRAAAAARVSEGEARRLLFDLHATSAAGQLGDIYAAEREALLRAHARGVTYVVGRSALRAAPNANWLKRQLLENLYGAMAAVTRPSTSAFGVPHNSLLHLGVDYEV